ncbi:hypothetical protein M422DRAFT_258064 [Sphaerobolus stellatus SS14]|uniref:Uncharacterized protein n=1 Tax=Sphaerobolus stellatus (strain SS14) TaxID=990650 RepID=A0A0C9U824_SPHS4|nr:hypothetical protein M422DRAFT_258064 [Sphaerobolus stellatus SS14]
MRFVTAGFVVVPTDPPEPGRVKNSCALVAEAGASVNSLLNPEPDPDPEPEPDAPPGPLFASVPFTRFRPIPICAGYPFLSLSRSFSRSRSFSFLPAAPPDADTEPVLLPPSAPTALFYPPPDPNPVFTTFLSCPSSLQPALALVPSPTQTPLPTNGNQNLPFSPIPLPLPAPSHSSSFLFTPACVGTPPLLALSASVASALGPLRLPLLLAHVPHQKNQAKRLTDPAASPLHT